MREKFRIVPTPMLRNERLERRVVEYNREQIFYIILVVGGVMVLIATVL